MPWDLHSVPLTAAGAARYFAASSLEIKIGFISSVSRPFCSDCDRIRLTADGLLYACLYDSANIRLFELLAAKSGRAEAEFRSLLQSKRFDGRHRTEGEALKLPSFSSIGG
jgi:cyclic pyranopterin phosphate synthase